MAEDTGLDLDATGNMGRAISALALELPEEIWTDVARRWHAAHGEVNALREQVAEMVRQRNDALAKVEEAWRRLGAAEEQVAEHSRLLGPARMALDRCAERIPGCGEEAARVAQRIVDIIGHAVTDEQPHAIVERDELREQVATLELEQRQWRAEVAYQAGRAEEAEEQVATLTAGIRAHRERRKSMNRNPAADDADLWSLLASHGEDDDE